MKKKIILLLLLILFPAGAIYMFILSERPKETKTSKEEEVSDTKIFSLAQQKANRGNCEQALKLYEQLLEKDPNHATALAFSAECLIELGLFEQALNKMEKAYELQPRERYKNKILYLYNKTEQSADQEF